MTDAKKPAPVSQMPLPQRGRRVVCRLCHVVMDDSEPMSAMGEFYHPTLDKNGAPRRCRHKGQSFYIDSDEVEPFMRKRTRRTSRRSATG
jgi:hypothetical protein